jgi:hypothetical protein
VVAERAHLGEVDEDFLQVLEEAWLEVEDDGI